MTRDRDQGVCALPALRGISRYPRDEDRGLAAPKRDASSTMTGLPTSSARDEASRGQGHDARDCPGEGGHLPGNGHDDLVDVLAAGTQLAIPPAQAGPALPTPSVCPGGLPTPPAA